MIERIPEHLRSGLKKTAYGYIIWVVLSIIGWFELPLDWKWIAYGPLAFVIIAIGLTIIIIAYQTLAPQPISFVFVGRTRVTACITCPMHEVKENPISPQFPIIKCMETSKTCYNACKIQRWCPYAK